jgi:hypothetical protein
LQKVVAYYLAFLVIDLGSAALALLMERREKCRLVRSCCNASRVPAAYVLGGAKGKSTITELD